MRITFGGSNKAFDPKGEAKRDKMSQLSGVIVGGAIIALTLWGWIFHSPQWREIGYLCIGFIVVVLLIISFLYKLIKKKEFDWAYLLMLIVFLLFLWDKLANLE